MNANDQTRPMDANDRDDRGTTGAREIKRPKLPVLRAIHTVSLPADPDPVSVEVLFLAETINPDDYTAERQDVPGLTEAGWILQSLGPLTIAVRTIF